MTLRERAKAMAAGGQTQGSLREPNEDALLGLVMDSMAEALLEVASSLKSLAFSWPAPNPHTPALVAHAISIEQEAARLREAKP